MGVVTTQTNDAALVLTGLNDLDCCVFGNFDSVGDDVAMLPAILPETLSTVKKVL
jgi:hypothetical protein